VVCFAICVLKMLTLWLGLRFEMPIVLRILNVQYVHIILKPVIHIAICIVKRFLHWLCL